MIMKYLSRLCFHLSAMLVKFPPNSVKMKQPFSMQPWDSSPEIVKKLFKVFHFLYTYSLIIDVCPFTLDEFAQAFHDKLSKWTHNKDKCTKDDELKDGASFMHGLLLCIL
ncbi:homeobox-DDT domain protein RLT3-like [Humulus lupulus]|uniref:homeobox-DDT domain protein RLT3-like n=1 Tax=Humulus lupulus TaxID=3486 RepID=UPI002B40FAD2|nr:homeobox-DDT domain protein RLT3-like [Humulus lupulus]